MSLALTAPPWLSLPGRVATLLEGQQGRFAAWLAVAMGAGVLAYFAQDAEPGPGALWLAAALLGLAGWAGRRRALAGWALALGGAACLGFGVAGWHAARMPPPLVLPAGAVTVSGLVREVAALPEGGRRVTLSAPRIEGGEPLPRTLRVRLRREDAALPAPGDRLTVRALLRAPSPPLVPGGWDFQRAAHFSGLGGSGFALGPAVVEAGEGTAPPLSALRQRLEASIAAALPGAAGAVATALLTGTQSAIPPAEMAAMRDSGLAHLLSVSGLHMTIVMGLVFGTLRLGLAPFALRLPGKPMAALGALAAGGFYMLLTGAEVPMQRCFAMAAIVTLGVLTGRRAVSVRVLAIAAAAVLLLDPAQILGPSFQMSFAAVLALVAGMEAARPALAPPARDAGLARRAAVWLGASVAVSVLAGLATAPFGLHHFGRLQLYGVLANAVAVPITSVLVMPAGMLALLAMPLGLEGLPLRAMGWGVEAVLWVAAAVAALPGAAPVLPPLPGWSVALAAFGFCWLCLWRGWPALPGAAVVVAALAAGAMARGPDVIVSADARLVLVRGAEGAWMQRLPGASSFQREGMLRAMGVAEAPAPPCGGAVCRIALREGAVAVLRPEPLPRGQRRGPGLDAATRAEACAAAPLVISPEPFRGACPEARVLDRFAVWRDGAHAAWVTPRGVRVVSDRGHRGARPWVPPPPLPGQPDPAPMAPLDPG